MTQARKRLDGARDALTSGHPDLGTSAAYYAMLYAARAALSERNLYAKTHGGVWSRFSEAFVANGIFDRELFREATAAQKTGELGDYEAQPASAQLAGQIIESADRFVRAIAEMLGDPGS